MQKVMDSLKADAGELRDKIREMESRARCQDQYIMSVEKRFVNLCEPCKAKGDETAFTPAERYSLQRIWELLEKQEERYKKNSEAGTRTPVTETGPDKEPGEAGPPGASAATL